MRQAWGRFWFASGSPVNLAAARVIIAVHALWVVLSRDWPSMANVPDPYWVANPSAHLRFLVFPGHYWVEWAVYLVVIAALVLVAAGRFVPVAAMTAALGLYHFGGLQTALFTAHPFNRGLTIATLGLITLSASPCAHALVPGRQATARSAPWEYHWPVKLLQLFVAQIYLFGLLGKLRHGLEFFTVTNIQRQAVAYRFIPPNEPLTGLGDWIAHSNVLAALAVGLLLVVEGGFIAALFSERWKRVVVPAALVFHVGIALSMQVVFASTVHLLLFVNWGGAPGGQLPGSTTNQ